MPDNLEHTEGAANLEETEHLQEGKTESWQHQCEQRGNDHKCIRDVPQAVATTQEHTRAVCVECQQQFDREQNHQGSLDQIVPPWYLKHPCTPVVVHVQGSANLAVHRVPRENGAGPDKTRDACGECTAVHQTCHQIVPPAALSSEVTRVNFGHANGQSIHESRHCNVTELLEILSSMTKTTQHSTPRVVRLQSVHVMFDVVAGPPPGGAVLVVLAVFLMRHQRCVPDVVHRWHAHKSLTDTGVDAVPD
mmetsp:Transcript_24234/g.63593  ORF Transcript_24234/g.63593 Transcript_24234/m.63593 type:complete len:249 (+) Transcript_24234:902-1648(+)